MAKITISIARTLTVGVAKATECNLIAPERIKYEQPQAAALRLRDMKKAPNCPDTGVFLASCIDTHSSYVYHMKAKMP